MSHSNNDNRRSFDDLEDLTQQPSGGRGTQWFVGIGLALYFVICGVLDLRSGHACLIGGRNGDMEFTGDAASHSRSLTSHWERFFTSTVSGD